MPDAWLWLLDILILLGAALALGTLAEVLRQNSIVGYLLAGMLVGPNALGLVASHDEVHFIAELGVTLLLFSIGLEFSFKRLLKLGPITYVGGTAQVVLTTLAGWGLASALGLAWRPALVIGMMVALSSTASVVRLLVDTTRIDSPYGRNALGILLLQDIAVVPLVILTLALGGENTPAQSLFLLGRTVVLSALTFGVFLLLFNLLVPKLLHLSSLARNRDLPVLLAVVMALGAAWAAHSVGLSPSFGAFLAGLLLAESPFAAQIRSDVAPLRTLLVTLFFAAVGMLVNPSWIAVNPAPVALTVVLIVILKPALIHVITRLLGFGTGTSLATGLCLGQVGEFSFVLATTALGAGVIDNDLFRLVVSVTVISLLVTPYLVRIAPRASGWAENLRPLFGSGAGPAATDSSRVEFGQIPDRAVIIIGFGPAGQQAAERLLPVMRGRLAVVDYNPDNSDWAHSLGIPFVIGDARRRELLEHLHLERAEALIVTVPDQDAVRQIIHLVKSTAPELRLLVRARYHIFKWELVVAGAEVVVDEEAQVGIRLAEEFLEGACT
ncbi:MAG: sodium:proton exchanger [Candidatus Glassbacteria bacterium]|nr:sodium:proton exchanger [Candidatus Glassbacteria bacterium]